MKKNGIKYLLALAVLTFSVSYGYTQQDDTEEIDLSVEIKGDAELFLNDANKVSKTPEIIESSVELPPLTYSLIPRKPQQKIELKPVPAAKVTIEEPLPNLFRGYAKGAVGSNVSGLGELRFMDGYSRNGTFDSYLKYFTSDGKVSQADSIPDSFSELNIGLSGKRFVKKHAVGINVGYDREKLHYYGYDPDSYPENYELESKRIYRTFNAGVNLKSYFRDSTKINYTGRFDFFQFSNNNDGSENNFIFNTQLNKFEKSENYAVGIELDYNQFKFLNPRTDDNQTANNTLFTLNPRITTYKENLMVKFGGKITANGMNGTKLTAYPDIEARYSLFGGIFIPYAGLGGEMHKNRYRTIAAENPFVQSFLVYDIVNTDIIRNTNEKINVYGGVRGNISSDMSFNAKLSRASFENYLFYANDSISTQGSRFRTDYASMKRTTITGELTYNAGEKVKFFGRGDFYIYDDFDREEPWDQPTNEIAISASYNIQDKLIAQLEISAVGERRAKSLVNLDQSDIDAELVELEDGTSYYAYNLDSFVDATLKVEYRYSKRLSAYGQINNMIAGKYQRFNAYPVQSFNFLAGATYSF